MPFNKKHELMDFFYRHLFFPEKDFLHFPGYQGSTVWHSAIRLSTVQGSTVQGSTVQGSTVQGRTVRGSTIQGSAVRFSTVQGSTIQGGTVQGSTIQRNTFRPLLNSIIITQGKKNKISINSRIFFS